MSRAEQMRAKARRVTVPAADVAPSDTAAAPLRSKPVRTTLDLSPDLYARFMRWCADTAPELGRPKLKTVDVARVLLARLLADEKLQRDVIADLLREGR